MKTIKQNELYQNLSQFLQTRGIELKEGAYAHRIQQGCTLLTEAINAAQRSLHKAKTEVESKVDEMRQAIHQKTAPRAAKATSARRKSSSATGGVEQAAPRRAARPKARSVRAVPRTRQPKA